MQPKQQQETERKRRWTGNELLSTAIHHCETFTYFITIYYIHYFIHYYYYYSPKLQEQRPDESATFPFFLRFFFSSFFFFVNSKEKGTRGRKRKR